MHRDLLIAGGSIDLIRRVGHVGNHPIRLTETEANLLGYLARHPGQAVSRHELLDRVWGYRPGIASRAVDTAIRRLRSKLQDGLHGPPAVLTERNIGYRLIPVTALPKASLVDDLERFERGYPVEGLTDRVRRSTPNEARTLGLRSCWHLYRGDVEQAIQDRRSAVELADDGECDKARFSLAQLLIKDGRFVEVEQLVTAIESSLQRNLVLATLALAQGDHEHALELHERVLGAWRNDPNAVFAYQGMGIVCFRLGRIDEALCSFSDAAQLARSIEHPRLEAQSKVLWAAVLMQTGRDERAKAVFIDVIEWSRGLGLGTITGDCHTALGQLARRRGALDEAAPHLLAARRLLDGSGYLRSAALAWAATAELAEDTGDLEEAQGRWQGALSRAQRAGDADKAATYEKRLSVL